MGDAPVSSHCSLVRNPEPKQTGVQENFREGETNCIFLTASLRRRRTSLYIILCTVEITVNYTSELKLLPNFRTGDGRHVKENFPALNMYFLRSYHVINIYIV
jgi:hypothetical protein